MIHLTPQLTIDRARTLSGLIDRAGESVESGAVASDPRGGLRQIVVELREDIQADDHTQHDAFMLKLEGGEWVDAEQKPVKVTNISDVTIEASEDEPYRCIARTIGNFGWCIEAKRGVVEICHAVIIEQCSAACSTYRVQKVHRYLKTVCDGGSGSGSGV